MSPSAHLLEQKDGLCLLEREVPIQTSADTPQPPPPGYSSPGVLAA